MDNKTESWRFPAAIALCALILFGWIWVSNKLWPPPPPRPPAPPVPAAAPPGATAPAAVVPPSVPVEKPVEHPAKADVVLDSKFLRATLTNRGAGVKALTLKYPEGKGEVELLAPRPGDPPPPPHLAVRIQGGPDPVETLNWEQSASAADSVEYRYRMRNGVELTKRFRILPDQHKLTLTLGMANRNAPPPDAKEPVVIPQTLELLAFHGLEHDSDYRTEQYFAGIALNEGAVKPRLLPDLEKSDTALQAARAKKDDAAIASAEKGLRLGGPHKTWFGLKSRFFAVLLAPDEEARRNLESYAWSPLPAPGDGRPHARLKNLAASGRTDALKVGGAPVLFGFEVFAGPVKRDVLKELPGAEKVLDYGGCQPFSYLVEVVAPMILGLLKFFGGMLKNYGVAIILTTLLIRLVLFPLSKKSQESAFRMQELGPKIQALRERYKDDQQKFGMEQMRLFREHKINPFSGCLPLLLQLPIFIGMYSVFEMSVELRNAPFVLWMRDLSEPDRLLGPWTPVQIPLIITTLSIDSLNLLPILMTIVWFLQAYLAPRSPDPQMAAQQKMMMFMPIFFGLMCYSLAAGLSLYFLVNSALSMAEQKLIKKFFLKPRTDAAGSGT